MADHEWARRVRRHRAQLEDEPQGRDLCADRVVEGCPAGVTGAANARAGGAAADDGVVVLVLDAPQFTTPDRAG